MRCQAAGLVPLGSRGISSSVVAHVGGNVKDGDKEQGVCFAEMALWKQLTLLLM